MEDLTHVSTISLAKEYSYLDRQIDIDKQRLELEILKYNLIRLELINRIPTLIDEPEFQEKRMTINIEQDKPMKLTLK